MWDKEYQSGVSGKNQCFREASISQNKRIISV